MRSGINYGVDYSVYRGSPKLCHSEICALVADGCNDDSSSALSWRHLSSLTRVIPDVMKLLMICFVVRNIEQHTSFKAQGKLSVKEQLDGLKVQPVVALARRVNNRSVDFSTVANIQKKYHQCSILAIPRKSELDVKKRK